MKLIDNLFFIKSLTTQQEGDTLSCRATLSVNATHAIYQAHFPSNPITPGAALIALVQEVVELVVQQPVAIAEIGNAKFLNLMHPSDAEGSTLHIAITARHALTATYTKADTTYAKLKMTLAK